MNQKVSTKLTTIHRWMFSRTRFGKRRLILIILLKKIKSANFSLLVRNIAKKKQIVHLNLSLKFRFLALWPSKSLTLQVCLNVRVCKISHKWLSKMNTSLWPSLLWRNLLGFIMLLVRLSLRWVRLCLRRFWVSQSWSLIKAARLFLKLLLSMTLILCFTAKQWSSLKHRTTTFKAVWRTT